MQGYNDQRLWINMKKVFIAHVHTNGGDNYYYAFIKRPSRSDIVKIIWEYEGKCGELSFYEETLSITIKQCEIRK